MNNTLSFRLQEWLLTRLSRVTQSGLYVPEIDGLRFVAITWVILMHLQGFIDSRTGKSPSNLITWLFEQGQLGVYLFFVISGFILGQPFARHWLTGAKPVSLQKYFIRRVTRLEPPYVIHLGIMTLVLSVAYISGLVPHLNLEGLGDITKHAIASLFYSHNLVYGHLNPVSWVLWSLEIEIQFYISMPLLALLYRHPSSGLRRARWLGLILIGGLLELTPLHDSWRFHHSLPGTLHYFLAGLLLADYYVTRKTDAPAHIIWDFVAITAWICIPILNTPLGKPFLPFAMMLAFAGAFWGVGLRRLFSNIWLATIGGMCYSIYLYHYLIILTFGRLSVRLPSSGLQWVDHFIQYLILFAVILIGSAIGFALLERPFMAPDWPTRLRLFLRRVN